MTDDEQTDVPDLGNTTVARLVAQAAYGGAALQKPSKDMQRAIELIKAARAKQEGTKQCT